MGRYYGRYWFGVEFFIEQRTCLELNQWRAFVTTAKQRSAIVSVYVTDLAEFLLANHFTRESSTRTANLC